MGKSGIAIGVGQQILTEPRSVGIGPTFCDFSQNFGTEERAFCSTVRQERLTIDFKVIK